MYGNICLYPSLWYKHLYSQFHNTFIAIENPQYHYEVFLKWKSFPFNRKRNFNPNVIIWITFNKTVCWYRVRDSSFLLDFLSKAKIFPNFSASNKWETFWQMSFYRFCKFSCLKKVNTIIFNFPVLQRKYKYFLINIKYTTVFWLFKMETFMWVYIHPHETWRSTNCMNVQFAPAHKVVIKDDN